MSCDQPTTMPYADALAAIEALEALVELQHAHIENLIERMAYLENQAGLGDPCGTCDGTGLRNGRTVAACVECDGSGFNPWARWNR